MAERLTRQQRQQRTRDQLLDAAEQLFADHGINGVSLDAVAAAAGLTKGAVYSNFANKDDLLAELIRRRASSPDPPVNLAGILGAGEPAQDRYEAVGAAYAGALRQQKNQRFLLFFVELWLYSMRHPQARRPFNDTLTELRRHWAGETGPDSALGDLPTDQLAAAFLAVELGVGIQHMVDPEAVPAQLYARMLRAVFGDNFRFPAFEDRQ